MAGILSPSLQNLFVGKAFATYQITYPTAIADTGPVHLGFVQDIEWTPNVEMAEYTAEIFGTGLVVDAVPTKFSASGKLILNEATMRNFSLLAYGTPNYATITAPQINIFSIQSGIFGILQIVQTNAKGPRIQKTVTNALIVPGGTYKPISEKHGTLELNFRHLADNSFSFGTDVMLADVNTVVPQNWTAPFITSPVAANSVPAGGNPAAASHSPATTLTCNIGGWTAGLGATNAFQWYRNTSNANTGGTVISGAINATYTCQSADTNDYLYCTVTVTNVIGSTSATTPQTQQVS